MFLTTHYSLNVYHTAWTQLCSFMLCYIFGYVGKRICLNKRRRNTKLVYGLFTCCNYTVMRGFRTSFAQRIRQVAPGVPGPSAIFACHAKVLVSCVEFDFVFANLCAVMASKTSKCYSEMTIAELKEELRKRKAKMSGKKHQLIER